jgi:hypothetical protein
VLVAVTATAIGFAYDAGSGAKELSLVFAASYMLGCIVAVLAVRQSGIFTAVIQPPLILFGAVPTAYFLFHGAAFTGIKDALINFGYPLIERFPLMFFTSTAVLVIGMARWYFGKSTQRATPRDSSKQAPSSSLASKVASLLSREPAEEDDEAVESPTRKHSIERSSRRATKSAADKPTRADRPTKRARPPQSRHVRPPDTELIEPVVERPRRPRSAWQTEPPPVPPAEPRRRPRTSSTREPRKRVPPAERRIPNERTERRRRYDDYQPSEPHGTNGNSTHHPVSRVRYRGDVDDAENRTEYRTPRRARRDREPERWEYDI